MTYTVKMSEQADRDLRGIYEYIAFTLLSERNADYQLKRLEDAITRLCYMPERFKRYEIEPWKDMGLRTVPVDNYILFYYVDEKNRTVTIVRVLYNKCDTEKRLNDFAGSSFLMENSII